MSVQAAVQQHGGPIGAGTTIVSALGGFFTQIEPILRGVSITLSIVVAILTIAWYIRRFVRDK